MRTPTAIVDRSSIASKIGVVLADQFQAGRSVRRQTRRIDRGGATQVRNERGLSSNALRGELRILSEWFGRVRLSESVPNLAGKVPNNSPQQRMAIVNVSLSDYRPLLHLPTGR